MNDVIKFICKWHENEEHMCDAGYFANSSREKDMINL